MPQLVILQLLLGNHLQRIVDALQALKIDLETVEKDAPHDVTADLRQCGITVHLDALRLCIDSLAHADHQHPIRAEMQRRTDRRKLPHRSVAKIFPVEPYGWKEKWNSRRCQKMINLYARGDTNAAMPFPRSDAVHPLVEGHRLSRSVAPGCDPQCVQSACINTFPNPPKRETLFEQLSQR